MSPEQFEQAKILKEKIDALKYRLDGINKADKDIEFGGFNLHSNLSYGISKQLYETIKTLLRADYESRINELEKQFNEL